ncbi:MAG: hypothetical protein ABJ310_19640 [Roseobacter sp.]
MSGLGRKELLCAQIDLELTGIDFIHVDPNDHTRVSVFFVIEPDALTRPVDQTADPSEFQAVVTGVEDGAEIEVLSHSWGAVNDASGAPRLRLNLITAQEGDFQTYRVSLTDTPLDDGLSRLDRFCAEALFSFKQACPTPFDCAEEKECPDEALEEYPVDYLARDFESFRQALLSFAADRYPDWDAAVPADFGGMFAELFAALGDEFSYIQDRFQREGYLATLSERRSFAQLGRLIDYRLDPGQAGEGMVVVRLYQGQTHPPAVGPDFISLPAGVRVWAEQGDGPAIPFEVGKDLTDMIADTQNYTVHTHWSDLPVYVPDNQEPCLPIGSREIFVNSDGLIQDTSPPEFIPGQEGSYWIGRQVLIETRPAEPDARVRRIIVTLDEPVERFPDVLAGAPSVIRLHWRAEDALPFELDQTQAFVSANLVPVRAGMTLYEDFSIGANGLNLPRTVERAGPARDGARPAIHRFTLSASVEHGLGWQTQTDAAGAITYQPDVALFEIDPAEADPEDARLVDWAVTEDSLSFLETDEAAALEPGRWAPVARRERRGLPLVHWDYAGNAGYTLRFGDGVFGRQPSHGAIFRAFYRTGPGKVGNVPADTIRSTVPPPGTPAPLKDLPNLPLNSTITLQNPFAITGGRDPQSLELARRIAPAAYKALTFRAVRDEDYRTQAERMDWVQQAGAVTRWTGAWPSTFVSADPKGAFAISDERFDALRARLSAVRQVGRCVIAKQPVFVALDLRIAICVKRGYAFADVAERVVLALAPARLGFFHPDRFSFGDPLRRPALEAAIACVEGVRSVMGIALRQRGVQEFVPFDFAELPVAGNRILKVENDANRPGQGSIQIFHEELPELEGV